MNSIVHRKPDNDEHRQANDVMASVQNLPAIIQQELPEPQHGNVPLPLSFVMVVCLCFFWAGFYLTRYSGAFSGNSFDQVSPNPANQAAAKPADIFAEGRRLFADTCAKCHQINGQGLPGQYPPIAMSEWVLAPGPARLIRIVLDGMQGPVQVKTETYNNPMLPWRELLSDRQIAGLLTYIRSEKGWGHSASHVTAEQVAEIRNQTKGRSILGAWTAAELLRIPEEVELKQPAK